MPDNLPSRMIVSTLALVVASSIAAASQVSPLAGTWTANLEKSARHENHQFKSATMTFEVSPDLVVLTYSGINMAGKEEQSTRRLHPDGIERPIDQAPGFVESAKWKGTNVLEVAARKDGNLVGYSEYEVSVDGKTLTATVKGVDARGRDFAQVIVFDRKM